jgi:uncharacterized caspase-like protein
MALVIGNNVYPWKPLVNSVNDARSDAAMLPKVGFDPRDVTLVTDATLRDLQRAGASSSRNSGRAMSRLSFIAATESRCAARTT